MKFRYSGVNPSAPVAYCAFYAMHTLVEVLCVSADEASARAVSDRIRGMVAGLERELSRHLEGGPLNRINSSLEFEDAGDELFFCLELSEQFRDATAGYFDVAALSTSRERPSCIFSASGHRVKRVSGGILLDMGGFAKGYAAEKVRRLLEEEGIANALVNFGNSTVLGVGRHPLGDCWKVSPAADESVCLELRDSALSVSGVQAGGRRHIVDPIAMTCPSKGYGVVVTGKSALLCEMLSTALYAAPEEMQDSIMKGFPAYSAGHIKL